MSIPPRRAAAQTSSADDDGLFRRSSVDSVHELVGLVARRKWWVIVCVLLCTGGAVAWLGTQTPLYSARALVLVEPRGAGGIFATNQTDMTDRSIQAEIQVIKGLEDAHEVEATLGVTSSPSIEVSEFGNTDVIAIEVRDENAETASELANAYAEAFVDVRREQSVAELMAASKELELALQRLQEQLEPLDDDDPLREALASQLAALTGTRDQLLIDSALRTGGATIVSPAEVPTEPVEPQPVRTVALAMAAGLLLGLVAAVTAELLDDRVRSDRDVRAIAGVPILASVPLRRVPLDGVLALTRSESAVVEALRDVRSGLQSELAAFPSAVVQFASAREGEATSMVAANVAVLLAQAGHRVVLIDGDVRQPSVHVRLDVPGSPGLREMAQGECRHATAPTIEVDGERALTVVCAGAGAGGPSELLGSPGLRTLLQGFRERFEFVIIDSAPVVGLSDAVALAGAVDAVCVVARVRKVRRSELRQVFDRLRLVDASVVGAVLTDF